MNKSAEVFAFDRCSLRQLKSHWYNYGYEDGKQGKSKDCPICNIKYYRASLISEYHKGYNVGKQFAPKLTLWQTIKRAWNEQ